jgi:4-amino-4-deoxy-L-arabinose transferase-like glycosyltransferase
MSNLALATLLLFVVSLSWAIIVDMTPEDQRPYVGSSGDNSELSLITGYNGLSRLLGMGFGRGNPGNAPRAGTFQQPNPAPGGAFQPSNPGVNRGFPQPGQGTAGTFPQQSGAGNDARPPIGFAAPGGGGGFPGTGRPGALRLLIAPLSKEVSWLLIFGVFSAMLLAFRARPHFPIAPKHQAVVLWGGWLLTGAIFFSVAGFFHEYYLSMLAAPLAALVGIGIVELWRIRERHPWIAFGLLLIATGATLGLQFITAAAFVRVIWWLPLVIGLFIIGAALLIPWHRQHNRVALAGFACIVAALLITPAIWSGLTVLNSSANQSLPSAYDGRSAGPANRGRVQIDQALLAYLQAHTQNTKYLMAVPSSMQGADYVLATGRPVLYLGGFMGQDRIVTSDDLARMVADGELRFVYWNAAGGVRSPGAQSDISAWVAATCAPVRGFDTTTQNMGAPDGIATRPGAIGARLPGGMQVSLYDCVK